MGYGLQPLGAYAVSEDSAMVDVDELAAALSTQSFEDGDAGGGGSLVETAAEPASASGSSVELNAVTDDEVVKMHRSDTLISMETPSVSCVEVRSRTDKVTLAAVILADAIENRHPLMHKLDPTSVRWYYAHCQTH